MIWAELLKTIRSGMDSVGGLDRAALLEKGLDGHIRPQSVGR